MLSGTLVLKNISTSVLALKEVSLKCNIKYSKNYSRCVFFEANYHTHKDVHVQE